MQRQDEQEELRGRRFDIPLLEVIPEGEEAKTDAAVVIKTTIKEEDEQKGPRNRQERRRLIRAARRERMRARRRKYEGRTYCGK